MFHWAAIFTKMRPDEHKKRKNAQYKKKHDIKDKAGSSDKKKEKTKDVPKFEGASRKPEKIQKLSPQDHQNSDSDQEQAFRRRGLVSNWSRYEDLPSDDDEELPTHRGEDFNKLIAAAGGASAQFRFQDEEGWDSAADSSEAMASVLSVNLEDLHQSLACIPLHKRLGIEEDLFSESQLTEMNEEAVSHDAFRDKSLETFQDTKKPLTDPNLSKTSKQTSAIIDKSASTDSVNDHSIINTNSDKDVTQIQTNSSVLGNDLTKSKKKEPPQNHDVPSLSTKVGAISHNSSATSMKQGKNNTLTQNDDTSCLEDDLDMLLSIDKPKTAQKPVLNSQNVNKEHVAKHTFVNGSDKPKEEHSDSTQISKRPSEKISKKDNLEDWLDSMLDD